MIKADKILRKGRERMTFQQLTYVVEISKCGSINKAAHKLFLSQSGISTAVRELEEELGIQFFVRSNRGVEFTPEGKEFLSYAVSLLDQKQRIESLYGEGRDTSAPVHFSVSTQRYPFTEDAFLKMLEHMPENRFQFAIKEDCMDAVIDDVYDHRADIGVIFMTELTEKIIRRFLESRELVFHEIATVAPCIFARKGHPLTKQSSVSEDDLSNYPYLFFAQTQGVAVDFAEECQVASLRKPAQCIVVNSRSTAMNVLARTDAITTGSGLLTEGISPDDVVTIPIQSKAQVHLGWIQFKNAKLSPYADEFIEQLKASVERSIAYTARVQQEK